MSPNPVKLIEGAAAAPRPLLSIQYLRAVAALSVVAFHSEQATALGQAGVDIFFVISGFIMWMVTAKPIGPGEFVRHRLIRIVPLYWIATIVMAVHQHAALFDVGRSLLFWPYLDGGGHIWPILVQGWTLNIEMFFYIVFAMTLIVPLRFRLVVISVLIGGLGLAGMLERPADPVLSTYSSPMMLEFLLGVWVAALFQRSSVPSLPVAIGLLALGIVLLATTIGDYTPELWRFVIWGIPSTFIVWGLTSIEKLRSVPDIAVLKLLGAASYSIYLFHPFILKTVARLLAGFPSIVVVVGVTAAGAAIGIAAYYLLEAPITAWLRRLSSRMPPWRVAQSAAVVRVRTGS